MSKVIMSLMETLVFSLFAFGLFLIAVFGTNPQVNIFLVVVLSMATLGGASVIYDYVESMNKK